MALSEEKQGLIVDAAIAEFQERGFAGASMDRISERAGVSKRTVYNHFASKEALFYAITQRLADRLNQALDLRYDPDEPIREQLVRLAWAEGGLFTDPAFMRLARMIMGETIRDPALAAEMNSRITKVGVFTEFLAAATRDGKLSAPDPALAADQFLALLKSQGFYPRLFTDTPVTREEMTEIVERSVDMIIRNYGQKQII
ncbi:TetR/AcrR family transcriptional regulator [Stappia sp. F7233]|uniref:TetR/AcrR family transcriptional regulator n=1 Tax=Stappia albiluteola TaxID=2758565 RepID=A0A839AHR9_9HYPH|nr:TetR/AcrR family transcriptional regulator [Stappia albiluteola]MBA5778578.1 TetR/AcrR family transcriptional regulator [Stappia albiluteola]